MRFIYCVICGHDRSDHTLYSTGEYGECQLLIQMTGPADNTDIYEVDCDCGQFIAEEEYVEEFSW